MKNLPVDELVIVSTPVVIEPQVYSVDECASLLGISRTTAFALIARDEFPAPIIKAGRRIVVPMAPLHRLLGIE